MPIRESSFRIGAGRYVQEEGLLARAGQELSRFGRHPLLIGDDTSLSITRPILEKSLQTAGLQYRFVTHNGTCNDNAAKRIAEKKEAAGHDMIVGVGGGVIMDFAKVCAHFAQCPVINIPTSSATCAAFTPLSVRYTEEGKTVGTMHFEREVDGVLADTAILSKQPPRLLLAGVFDALAKFIEIKQRFSPTAPEETYPMGLDYAYVLAKHSYQSLQKNIAAVMEESPCDHPSEGMERVFFTTIAVTGVISGVARGSNQCALAHKFYETTRLFYPESARPYLHGEIVGVGLLLQNHFNGEAENNKILTDLMKKYGLASSILPLGIPPTEDSLREYEAHLQASSAIDETNEAECRRLQESLRYLWSLR